MCTCSGNAICNTMAIRPMNNNRQMMSPDFE
jgi:hypothetical protein